MMPYGAQDGVWGGLRGDFGAEATVNAISGSQCHIGVASDFRVGGGSEVARPEASGTTPERR